MVRHHWGPLFLIARLKLKGLYMYSGGFYLYSSFALVVWETRRSDFAVSMAHHIATSLLIVLSYIFRWVLIASSSCYVYYVHCWECKREWNLHCKITYLSFFLKDSRNLWILCCKAKGVNRKAIIYSFPNCDAFTILIRWSDE